MTEADKLTVLADLVEADEGEERRLSAYLHMAQSKILNRMYPFGIPQNVKSVPTCYEDLQIEIAAYMYNKRGSEGETSRTENGVARVFGSSDVPEPMLRAVTPMGKVL